MWRRRREAASAGLSAALYSVYSGLYSEAVVSFVASAVALAEVGQFGEAVQYVQKAAKALYEAAKEAFEKVKVAAQRLVELFVEAVARVLAWIDEHKAYLFLMAAVAAGAVALSVALNLWGLLELDKLAYAASLTPFVVAGVREYPREEAFNILRSAPDPYEEFKKIAREANAGRVKLAEPWESLRVLILPTPSEESRLMKGKAYRELDEGKKKALFYAVLALEEAFGVYRTALRKYAETVQRVEIGEGPFKRVMYVADVGRLIQLAEEEEAAFGAALKILRERLNEYTVKYGLRDLLDVKEGVARRLAEATALELFRFSGMNFGVKAYAVLIAYRENALGRRGAFGTAVRYWLEVGGSAWPFYYPPKTAYDRAKKAGVERPVAVEELVAEGLRRLFLKPGADHYRGFVGELTKGGRLALELEEKKTKEKTESYVFKLFRVEENGGFKELGIKLRITKVEEGEEVGITYTLIFEIKRWLGFFKQELEAAVKAAGEVGERLPVEDRFSYMGGWVDSDVAISKGRLMMGTSHLWQLAETHALFDWSKVVGLRMNLTLEGPKLVVDVEAPLEKLNETTRRSAESGWLKMLGIKAESWDGLKRWVAGRWDVVVDAAVSRLRKVLKEEELERLLAQGGGDALEGRKGRQVAPRDKQKDGKNVWEGLRRRLEALRDRLNDDKVAREVVAPALLLIQAERLGVNETALRYFGAVVSSTIDGDGHVSAAMRVVGLTSGERGIALLWGAVLAAYGIEAKVRRVRSTFQVIASGGDAARLARLYFCYGPPLLERDDRLKSHKLDEAMKLGAEGLDIRWEGLRRRTDKGLVAADLTISESDTKIKYNVYLWEELFLQFQSTDRSRVELAARLLRLAGVGAEVKKRKDRDVWYIRVTTDRLATGHKELRDALLEIVRKAVENGWIDAGKAGGWLEKLERGVTLMKGWPRYDVQLARSGALVVRFGSSDRNSIEREKQRLENMGLEEGKHFSVKMPEGRKAGYVRILKEGLEHAAWLSVHGEGERQRLAADFVEYILQRAEGEGDVVYEKASKIVEEGKARGSQTLRGFVKEVEVDGKKYVVKVRDGEAVEEDRGGRKLLRIKITAEVGRVWREYVMTYGRYGRDNATLGYATARADAPGGREEDAERFSALIKALTGREPKVYRRSDGVVMIECYEGHLEGFMRYKELAEAIKRWMEKTNRR